MLLLIDGILKFLSDKIREKSAVIGLSGGVDSSLVLTLLSRVLEKEKIIGVYMPDLKSPPEDLEDVDKICRFNNVSFRTINIEGILSQYKQALKIEEPATIGNMKSRIRMSILYSIANSSNGIVVGTTNKSEYLTGYFTKYGDGGCDIEPIIGLYKTQVWELSSQLGLPASIINKKPSARLWESQTDEDDLGISYVDLDKTLIYFQENGEFPNNREGKIVSRLYLSSLHKRKMPYNPEEDPAS